MGMLDAWKLVKDDIPHHLYLTGGMDWKSNEVFRRFADSDFERIHLLGCVKESDMPVIYSLSDFVIYISLFEGFGLPVLEAMSCGVPVMASDISSIPEVTGDSALLIDPYSVQSIAAGTQANGKRRNIERDIIQERQPTNKTFFMGTHWGRND